MTNSTVPLRLKALREQAGLTVRGLADLLGMSSSGYSHYETPARFKDTYLPLDMALRLLPILSGRGVSKGDVLALAGASDKMPVTMPGTAAPGFSEGDAAPWIGQPGKEDRIGAMSRAAAPGLAHAGTYRISRDMPGLGLLAGDVIIVDRRAAPRSGQLALGNVRVPSGAMVAVLGRISGHFLLTHESLTQGVIFDLDNPDVAAYHPVIAMFRTDFSDESDV